MEQKIAEKFDNIIKTYNDILENIDFIWLPSATEDEEIRFLKGVSRFLRKIENRFSLEFLDSQIRKENKFYER